LYGEAERIKGHAFIFEFVFMVDVPPVCSFTLIVAKIRQKLVICVCFVDGKLDVCH
jgi:hypothetical protein